MLRFLKNLPILVKGLGGAVLIAGALIAVNVLALNALSTSAGQMTAISDEELPTLQRSAALSETAEHAHLQLLRLVGWVAGGVSGDTLDRQTATTSAALAEFEEALAQEADLAGADIAAVVEAGPAYLKAARDTADMAALDAMTAIMFLNGAEEAFNTLNGALGAYSDAVRTRINDGVAEMAQDSHATVGTVTAVTAAAAVLGLLLMTVIQLSLARPIQRMTGAMQALSENRTDVAIPCEGQTNELGRMAATLGVFRGNIAERARLEAASAEQRVRDEARATASEALQTDLAEVLGRAGRGDFDGRMAAHDDYPEMARIASAVNDLLVATARGLGETQAMLSALAAGDLERRMPGGFEGAFAHLAADANATAERLEATIRDIRGLSEAVLASSSAISEGGRDLSSRAENQAASIEEIAATMEEMSSTIKLNSDNAETAVALSRQAADKAGEGRGVAGDAVGAIRAIETSTGRIGDIIAVIDSIATQTNLLALNAAVEAARSGEAGKGFAVVAAEVRTLAHRATEAARDISGLISESADKVRIGVGHVEGTAEALSAIGAVVEQLTSAVQGISEAGREQALGVGEVSTSIHQLDQITQENAGLADESARATGEMAEKINQLNALLAAFRVGGEAGARAAA
jgi:methyl-accepting chemotaxis protein